MEYEEVCVSENAGLDQGSGASLGLECAHLTDTFAQPSAHHLNKLGSKEYDRM